MFLNYKNCTANINSYRDCTALVVDFLDVVNAYENDLEVNYTAIIKNSHEMSIAEKMAEYETYNYDC